jgi:peptidoglycan/LPS O-acetylase OafA/YrhL
MQILSIQILRALAALSVTVGHGLAFIGMPLEKLGRPSDWSYFLPWGGGVDLFFVISGFIMVYSSERLFGQPGGGRTFIWRRISRIVPLYWAAMVIVLVRHWLWHKPMPSVLGAITSFLFVPYDTFGSGVPRPFYELGWTLNYEMFFYAVFALFIGFARERAVLGTALALTAIVALGAIFHFTNPVLCVWSQPIVFEFIFGMGLALLARHGYTLPDRARYGLFALGAGALLIDFLDSPAHPHEWMTPNDFARVFAWGVPAAMILAGATLKQRDAREPGLFARAGAAVGDASYALYLVHPMVMSAFASGWFKFGVDQYLPPRAGVAIEVALSIVAALLVYRWFERPVTDYLQSKRRALRYEALAGAAARPTPQS